MLHFIMFICRFVHDHEKKVVLDLPNGEKTDALFKDYIIFESSHKWRCGETESKSKMRFLSDFDISIGSGDSLFSYLGKGSYCYCNSLVRMRAFDNAKVLVRGGKEAPNNAFAVLTIVDDALVGDNDHPCGFRITHYLLVNREWFAENKDLSEFNITCDQYGTSWVKLSDLIPSVENNYTIDKSECWEWVGGVRPSIRKMFIDTTKHSLHDWGNACW